MPDNSERALDLLMHEFRSLRENVHRAADLLDADRKEEAKVLLLAARERIPEVRSLLADYQPPTWRERWNAWGIRLEFERVVTAIEQGLAS